MADQETTFESLACRTGPIERQDLPLPRLQLRWVRDEGGDRAVCHYELAFRLGPTDRRSGGFDAQVTITLGETVSQSGNKDWQAHPADLRPLADGAHAAFDSRNLHDLPVFVIRPDGKAGRYWPEPRPVPQPKAKPVPSRLSPRQIDAIRHGRDKGGGIFVPGSNAGGAIYRMCERLAQMGLLSPTPPFPATEAGRDLLAAKGL